MANYAYLPYFVGSVIILVGIMLIWHHQQPQTKNSAGNKTDKFSRKRNDSTTRSITPPPDKRTLKFDEWHESIPWLPDAIIVLDHGMHLNWANTTAEKWFGFKAAGNIYMDVTTLINSAQITQFIRNRDYNVELDCLAPANPEITISIRVLPYIHGQYLLQARDVTHVKALEHIRRDFVANASHELRTPISILYGYLEIMLQDGQDGISDEWKPAIIQMHEQTSRIKQIIEDMMMLSRLEDTKGEEDNQVIDMEPLLSSIAENARILSGSKFHKIYTKVDKGYKILGSRRELESLVFNLVSNAVQYTPAQGEITIVWNAQLASGTLSVKDTGIGIDKDDIPRITERFYRTDSARSRETGGTGLGLAIVNHIVSRHQATLKIESKLGKGSTFSVIFPSGRIRQHDDQTSLLFG